MMASFIVAVKGSVSQAALLGLCAAISHSLIVWILAALAIKLGNDMIAEQSEPYLMLFSAVVVLGVAVWMFMRTRRDVMNANAHHHHGHVEHDHSNHNDSYQDAHERYHAEDIKRRFVGQTVSTGQIAMFGLTGGLVPCPASVTILMICLHLKKFSLGAAMVASFSFGLALSLVSVGVIAAWGAQQVGKRLDKGNLIDLARKMPYLSSGLMAVVATVMGIQALSQIMAG
jgi:nickel/cobalt exporter